MPFDLIVAGAGPVGASLACALEAFSVAVVAAASPHPVPDEGFDARVYALSPGNVSFLDELGAWRLVPPERRTPVFAMRVFGDDGRSEIHFDAYRAGVPQLAWIVEDAALQAALWQLMQRSRNVELLVPDRVERVEVGAGEASALLASGGRLRGRLLVGADGADSAVRRHAAIEADIADYGQIGVAANFACSRGHDNVAWQWFGAGGILAMLPLPGAHASMIWSLPQDEARRRLALDPAALCAEVEQATRGALGALRLVNPPKGFKLRRIASRRLVAPRVALAGDAAHVIHPLAGQGLNLGMQDARELAKVLATPEAARDPGAPRLLRRYERSRAEPILSMGLMVDGLYRLFGSKHRATGTLRNAGLNLTDRMAVVKNVLIRQAMR